MLDFQDSGFYPMKVRNYKEYLEFLRSLETQSPATGRQGFASESNKGD